MFTRLLLYHLPSLDQPLILIGFLFVDEFFDSTSLATLGKILLDTSHSLSCIAVWDMAPLQDCHLGSVEWRVRREWLWLESMPQKHLTYSLSNHKLWSWCGCKHTIQFTIVHHGCLSTLYILQCDSCWPNQSPIASWISAVLPNFGEVLKTSRNHTFFFSQLHSSIDLFFYWHISLEATIMAD